MTSESPPVRKPIAVDIPGYNAKLFGDETPYRHLKQSHVYMSLEGAKGDEAAHVHKSIVEPGVNVFTTVNLGYFIKKKMFVVCRLSFESEFKLILHIFIWLYIRIYIYE